jgi:hypothetical protein
MATLTSQALMIFDSCCTLHYPIPRQEAILRSLDPPNERFDFVQYISG